MMNALSILLFAFLSTFFFHSSIATLPVVSAATFKSSRLSKRESISKASKRGPVLIAPALIAPDMIKSSKKKNDKKGSKKESASSFDSVFISSTAPTIAPTMMTTRSTTSSSTTSSSTTSTTLVTSYSPSKSPLMSPSKIPPTAGPTDFPSLRLFFPASHAPTLISSSAPTATQEPSEPPSSSLQPTATQEPSKPPSSSLQPSGTVILPFSEIEQETVGSVNATIEENTSPAFAIIMSIIGFMGFVFILYGACRIKTDDENDRDTSSLPP